AQQFHFEVDLGSPYSWVADISCTIGCTSSMELYNPSLSSTATQISTGYSINYTSGSVSGNLVTDTVRLGAYTVPSQFFFTANHLSGYIVGGTSSGVVGLTYQQTADGPSFPMSLFLDSKGQLASAEMSFWVNRLSTSIDDEENPVGGAFTYGGTNTSFYQGEIDFLPTTGSSSWKLNVQEIIIQGKSVQITSGASALAGFSLSGPSISGPASDVAAIWAAFPAAVPSTTHSGYYQFPCSTTVSVSISFGGRLWPINPVDMNLGLVAAGSSQCLGAIYTPNLGSNKINTDGRANWIFGTAFMRNVYSVFQPNPFSIGFAKLSIPAQTGVFPPSGSASKRSVPRGAIVGGVVGGVVVVVLFVVCNVRRRKPRRWILSPSPRLFPVQQWIWALKQFKPMKPHRHRVRMYLK
ncbi:aspartic peptidase domain-containing protein, partial [Mycena leptocephala]